MSAGMANVGYMDLVRLTGAEIWVMIATLVVLAVDLTALRGQTPPFRRLFCGFIATAGGAVSLAWLFAFPMDATVEGGIFQVNRLTQTVKASILLMTVLSLWLTRSNSTGLHVGEFFCLVLLSATGMMLLVSARDLLTILVSLELSSIPLYVLAAFDQSSKFATRSSLKYFLLGSTATAFMLFGFSLLYGGAGSTQLAEIGVAFYAAPTHPLLLGGLLMSLAGFAFKLAAAPFHLWAPDIYRDASAPAVAFISSASKTAAIIILFLLISSIQCKNTSGALPIAIAVVTGVSIVIGTAASLVQTDLRRLLAYSAVGHAGFMMLSLFSSTDHAAAAVVYYATTYGIATVGLFSAVALVQTGVACPLTTLNGLGRKDWASALALAVLVLSLAGVPPTAGFFGKFYLFSELIRPEPGHWMRFALLLLALAASAVSFYYYVLILKHVYVRDLATMPLPQEGSMPQTSGAARTCLLVCAVLVLLAGIRPDWLLALVLPAIH